MIWHPMSILAGQEKEISIVSAKDEYLYTDQGQKIIDAISSWWTCIHGHRNPKIMEAIRKQTESLDHVIFAGFTHEPAERLSDEILKTTKGDFEAVFFSDNGSNAIEIAVKLAVQFFKNKNLSKDSQRKTWIRFTKSYHGDSIGAMSLGGQSVFTRIFRDLNFPTKEYISPDCTNCPFAKSPDTCNVECLDEMAEDLKKNGEQFVGAVVEPLVSGANGMVFHDVKFLQRLRKLTQDKDIILVLDEVFTGLYRTGEWYAYQKAEIKPDMICIAKGLTGGTLPLALTLITEKIVDAFRSDDVNHAFYHGHTMAGSAIACSAALASLEILQETGEENISRFVSYFQLKKKTFDEKFAGKVKNIRHLGAIFAMEVVQDLGPDEYLNPIGRKIRAKALAEGVLIRPLGNTVYITPPYNIHKASLDQIFSVLEAILEKEFTLPA